MESAVSHYQESEGTDQVGQIYSIFIFNRTFRWLFVRCEG